MGLEGLYFIGAVVSSWRKRVRAADQIGEDIVRKRYE
jgi:hypothetical protein